MRHIMSDNINLKLNDWLEKSGFILEMKAANSFRQANFEVEQSAFYVDSNSTKGREIDVLASEPDDIWGIVNLTAVIECKSAKNPWLIFMSDDVLPAYKRLRTFSVKSQSAKEFYESRKSEDFYVSKYLPEVSRCGYGFRQALLEPGKDAAYEAAMGVISACNSIASAPPSDNWKTFSVSLPIIVVNTPIFEVQLNDENQTELTQVISGSFLFSAYLPTLVQSVIHVVHIDAIDKFAAWTKGVIDAFRQDLQSEEDSFLETFTNPPLPEIGELD